MTSKFGRIAPSGFRGDSVIDRWTDRRIEAFTIFNIQIFKSVGITVIVVHALPVSVKYYQ